jgi:alpha-L-fucosidase
MAQPKPGDRLTIHSFSAKAGLLDQPIRSITLQGSHARLNWKQTDNGVVITIPQKLPTAYVNAFRVELVKAK